MKNTVIFLIPFDKDSQNDLFSISNHVTMRLLGRQKSPVDRNRTMHTHKKSTGSLPHQEASAGALTAPS